MSQNMYGINNNYNEYTCLFLATDGSLKIKTTDSIEIENTRVSSISMADSFGKAELGVYIDTNSYRQP